MIDQPNLKQNNQYHRIFTLSNVSEDHLYNLLNTSKDGLSVTQYQQNISKYGLNLTQSEKNTWLIILVLKYFFKPLPIVLFVLAGISYLTGEVNGAFVITLMVILSTIFGFFQEYKSTQVAKKLSSLVKVEITIERSAKIFNVDQSDIVPGDIVHLSVGDLIPADIRILDAKDLFVNQSSLNGESFPVEKSDIYSKSEPDTIFDLQNIALMGSYVVSGIGKGIVLASGQNTVFGQLAGDIDKQTKQSAFEVGINAYAYFMVRIMLIVAIVVFLINGALKGDWLEAGLFAIAIGVGLTPEMLPLLVTINLSKGSLKLSKRHVIIKRLSAVQNLGAMNILCTDKTGTLTQNKIIVEKYVDIYGNQDATVLEYSYLNSHYQSGLKNLLDLAILEHIDVHQKLHQSTQYKKIDEIPFDFERRRMSVVLRKDEKRDLLICKGAIEEIIGCCNRVQFQNETQSLDKSHLDNLNRVVTELNKDGFRVIAVAIQELNSRNTQYTIADETNLILLGYVLFLDPPKESSHHALHLLVDSGIQVKVLTGDNPIIANKVCGQVGLKVSDTLIGSQIEKLSDKDLIAKVRSVTIFAKLTPNDKARIINAFKSDGNVVGYMGDGINDAPALIAADVSISVDSAVDIAKESADIILLEKNLDILHMGVIEGRLVFANIMKYLKMSASSNFGNVISMCGASILLPFLPMAPIQIILNNLLYDFSQTAVASDNVDHEYLQFPRTWDLNSLKRFIFVLGPISSLFDYLVFGFMWYFLKANTIEASSLFQTGWFVESLLSQTLIVHVIRTSKIPFIESNASHLLLVTTIFICFLGVFLPYSVYADRFHFVPLGHSYWLYLICLLPVYMICTQLVKMYLVKLYRFI